MIALLALYVAWRWRLYDRRFWSFVWCKLLYETVSGYGPGELDHWPEARRYSRRLGVIHVITEMW